MTIFENHRPLLFSIAYRMLGTVMEAEDMVQETFLRWESIDPTTLDSPKAYLTTIITRICLDKLKSAQVQREQYIGEWLPEPYIVSPDTPDQMTELAASLSIAFLHMLERLSPTERAIFLLREVFGYSYAEIAAIVDKNEAACRQTASDIFTARDMTCGGFDICEHFAVIHRFGECIRVKSQCYSWVQADRCAKVFDGDFPFFGHADTV